MAVRQQHQEDRDRWHPGSDVPVGVVIAYGQRFREEQGRLQALFQATAEEGCAALSSWGARLLDPAKGLPMHQELSEREHILPFLSAHPHLAAALASYALRTGSMSDE